MMMAIHHPEDGARIHGDRHADDQKRRDLVLSQMRAIIADQLAVDPQKVTEQTSFSRDLAVDSLGSLQLLTAMEDCFGVEIPDIEFERIQTVADAMDLVMRLDGNTDDGEDGGAS